MRRYAAAPAALAALALAATGPARADDVTDQIDQGRAFYQQGDHAGAITELEFALNAIRAKLSQLYTETLPAPPPGWGAGEAEVQGGAMFGGGAVITRAYREEGGRGTVDARLMVDNAMAQGMAALFANPALLAAQPGIERVRVGRDNAVLKWEAPAGAGEITLLIGGRVVARLEGRNLPDKAFLVDLLNAWDFARVREIAGI